MIRLLELEKFPLGVADCFACQAKAQHRAFIIAAQQGGKIIPVWNKSNREHRIAGSEPSGTPAAAAAAVKELGWRKPCHGLENVTCNLYERRIKPLFIRQTTNA